MVNITIDEVYILYNYMIAANYVGAPTYSTVGYFWDFKKDITSITFDDEIDFPSNVVESWDISDAETGKIMAYIIDDGLGTNTYSLHIQSDEKIYANPNSSYWFSNFSKLVIINNLNVLNTSQVTDMESLFLSCSKLVSIDLSSFDTSKVTDFGFMFSNCSDLVSLDLSNFYTPNLTNVQMMFTSCSSLTTLNVANFNTSQTTNMSMMFQYCTSLPSLDLSSFDTSNVTEMFNMFYNCYSLLSLNLTSFNTSKVTNMQNMFHYCGSLTELDLSSFDMSSAEVLMLCLLNVVV